MKKIQGFTLIELLVVIAIIGILSSVVMASLNSAREKARIAKVQSELNSIATAIGIMELDVNEWPGHQTSYEVNTGSNNEIEDITVDSAGVAGTDGSYWGWNGPYIDDGIIDPWGNPYFFDTDYDINRGVGVVDFAAVIGSYGPNGVGLNQYDSDDIIKILKQE